MGIPAFEDVLTAMEAGDEGAARERMAAWPGHRAVTPAALQAGVEVVRNLTAASAALRRGRLEDLVRSSEQALATLRPGLPWLEFLVASVFQASYRFTGRADLRRTTLDLLDRGADRLDLPRLAIMARGLAGNVHLMHGAMSRAAELCDAGIDLAAAVGLEDDPATATAWQFRGYVLYEWNDLDGAAASLERAWERASDRAGVASGVARAMARISSARGNKEDEAAWIERLEAAVRPPLTLRNREWLAAVRIGHEAGRVEVRAIQRWSQAYGYDTPEGGTPDAADVMGRLHEWERVLTHMEAIRQWPGVERIAPVMAGAARAERRWFAVRALTALAVARDAQGRRAEADALWRDAMQVGGSGELVRAYVEGSPTRLGILRRTAASTADVAADARRALDAAGDAWRAPAAAALTPGQTAVLVRIAAGDSNKAAARSLGVSVNTVRAHLRAIYSRLDVGSRTQAVAVARERGFLV